jgi:hypothetical protein
MENVMDASVYVGLVVFAALFVLSGINHIKSHEGMAGYTASVLPESLKPLGYLGGWPTGVFLAAFGAGAGFGQAWALYGLAGFLVLATALFHRNFVSDPGGFKGVALAGAALALAQLVH